MEIADCVTKQKVVCTKNASRIKLHEENKWNIQSTFNIIRKKECTFTNTHFYKIERNTYTEKKNDSI